MKPKRILTLLTAAGICLGNIPLVPVTMPSAVLTASAANSGTCGENVTWTLNNGVLTISGTGAMKDQDLPNDFSSLNFSKAVITDGVTSIGQMSFERCFGLKSVTIPGSVTSIGFQAFYQCTSLTDITIPDSVTDFGPDVFNETPWLEAKQNENPLVVVNNILIDGSTCTGEVTIPDGITCIGTYAFDLCKELTGVMIPDSVTRICGGAFASCWNLKSITIPKGVTCIEDGTFSRCNGLTDVQIPDSVTSIGASAFLSCYALKEIRIPDSVTSIDKWAFEDCSALTSITIPSSVTNISEWAFTGCKKLTIKGYTGSYAESYASANNIPFSSIGELSTTTTTAAATTAVTTTTAASETAAASTAADPSDSMTWNGHKYQLFDLGMTWDEADAYCKSCGGHLAAVTSAEEQAVIENLLASGTKNHYWLGGQFDNKELSWITGEEVAYTHWATGQPDNYFGDEDSLIISREPVGSIVKPYDWHDLNRSGRSDNSFRDLFGTENIGFICEWDTAGRDEHKEHGYKLFDLGMTWDEADAYCKAQGGHLATVTSAEEQTVIESLLASGKKNHYWLGGQFDNKELSWITGEEVAYTHWATGQPDNYFGDEDSLIISREPVGSIVKPYDWHDLNRSGRSDNSFRDLFGTENIGFICEWEGQEGTPQVTTTTVPETTTASLPGTTTTAVTTTAAEITTTAAPQAVRSAFETIEAESADELDGPLVVNQSEDLAALGYITDENYAVYRGLDFGDGALYFTMQATASTSATGGIAELHLDSADGTLIGSVEVPLTGQTDDDWLVYHPFTTEITPTEGVHDLYLVFRNDNPHNTMMNVDQFVFSKEAPQKALPGDVNSDGSIDLKDVTVLRRHLAGGWNVTISEANSDVNKDGSIDLKDVTILRRYLAGGWGVTLG